MRHPFLLTAAALCLFGIATASQAAVLSYSATLAGAAENPANASAGSGSALVAFDAVAHTLDVNVAFADLGGTTLAAHIHGPVAAPGNAGVITTVPTFPSFPLGVTSGGSRPASIRSTSAPTTRPS